MRNVSVQGSGFTVPGFKVLVLGFLGSLVLWFFGSIRVGFAAHIVLDSPIHQLPNSPTAVMGNKVFLTIVLVMLALVGLAVMMHTPGGVRAMRSMRGALHGG